MNDFFLKERFLILAYDHGMEHGPLDFSEISADPELVLKIAQEGRFSAIVLTPGIAEKFYFKFREIPLILKLNGKTRLSQEDPVSLAYGSVDLAKRLGAVGVGYTLYPGSKYESLMLKEFGKIKEEAHQKNLGVVAWVYPRGKAIENETDPEIIKYAARIGLEIGADLIKIKYPLKEPEFLESFFKEVRKVAPQAKIALAGGEKLEEEKFLEILKVAMKAGLNGVVVGRNVWQRENPFPFIEKIRKIIFEENQSWL